MSQLDTVPSSVEVGTGETVTYNIDTSAYLTGVETLQINPAPSAVVYLASTNATVPNVVVGVPGISGNVLQITLNCGNLAARQDYIVIFTFYVTATKILQGRLAVSVVF